MRIVAGPGINHLERAVGGGGDDHGGGAGQGSHYAHRRLYVVQLEGVLECLDTYLIIF